MGFTVQTRHKVHGKEKVLLMKCPMAEAVGAEPGYHQPEGRPKLLDDKPNRSGR